MSDISTYIQIVSSVISAQGQVMGPLAINEARKVPGLVFSNSNFEHVTISGEPGVVITGLVRQYERVFGTASIEVCKDAVKEIKPSVSPEFLPEILR